MNGSLDDPLAEYRDLYARGCRDLGVPLNLAQLELAADFSDQAVAHAQLLWIGIQASPRRGLCLV